MKLTTLFPTIALLLAALPLAAQPNAGRGPGGPGRGPGLYPPTAPATQDEIRIMKAMREEEKLARDVYRFLAERWKVAVFSRIAEAEQQHFTTMGTMLTRYGVTDPVVTDTAGVFADERFTKLYAELTAKGVVSLKDALEVGVLVEKTDIADLEASLPITAKLDLKRVLTNLMMASHSHLEAFEFNLEISGQ
jgi:hypothetical protein